MPANLLSLKYYFLIFEYKNIYINFIKLFCFIKN